MGSGPCHITSNKPTDFAVFCISSAIFSTEASGLVERLGERLGLKWKRCRHSNPLKSLSNTVHKPRSSPFSPSTICCVESIPQKYHRRSLRSLFHGSFESYLGNYRLPPNTRSLPYWRSVLCFSGNPSRQQRASSIQSSLLNNFRINNTQPEISLAYY